MTTTLISNTYKAVKKVYSPPSKLPKPYQKMPILHTVMLTCEDGYVKVTGISYDDENGELVKSIEKIPARCENDLQICVKAKAFMDWLHASQLTKHEKAINTSEQVNFKMGEDVLTDGEPRLMLLVTMGNTRTKFVGLPVDDFPHLGTRVKK